MDVLEGTEHRVPSNYLVPLGGKLPLYQEMRTGQILDVLLECFNQSGSVIRKKLNNFLYAKTRPGFYLEIKTNLHLAYVGQPDGHGTQHLWRLFFDEQWQELIERASRSSALTVSKEGGDRHDSRNTKTNPQNAPFEWGGMYFRSAVEVKIAEALDGHNVLFFANTRGRVAVKDSPAVATNQAFTGRLEVDFLVFHLGRCMVLEVDGKHHNEGSQTIRDYIRDRVLLREGIPTARFTATECQEHTEAVVVEFLNLFPRH